MERATDFSNYRSRFPPKEHEEAVRMLLEGLDKEAIEMNLAMMQQRSTSRKLASREDDISAVRSAPRSPLQEQESRGRAASIRQHKEQDRKQLTVQSSSSSVDSADPLASCSDAEQSDDFATKRQYNGGQNQLIRQSISDAEESAEESIQVSPQICKKQVQHPSYAKRQDDQIGGHELRDGPVGQAPRMQSKATSTTESESSSVSGALANSSTFESADDDISKGNYEAIPNRTIAVQCDLKVSSVKRAQNGAEQASVSDDSSTDLASMQASSISSTRYGFYKLSPETMEQRRRLARSISSRNIARSSTNLSGQLNSELEDNQSDQMSHRGQTFEERELNHEAGSRLLKEFRRGGLAEGRPGEMENDPNEGYDSELEVARRRALTRKLLPQTKANASLPRRPRTAMSFVSTNHTNYGQAEPNRLPNGRPYGLASSRDRAMSQQVLNGGQCNDFSEETNDVNNSNSDGEQRDERERVAFNEEIVLTNGRRLVRSPSPMVSNGNNCNSDNENLYGGGAKLTRANQQQLLRRSATLRATSSLANGARASLVQNEPLARRTIDRPTRPLQTRAYEREQDSHFFDQSRPGEPARVHLTMRRKNLEEESPRDNGTPLGQTTAGRVGGAERQPSRRALAESAAHEPAPMDKQCMEEAARSCNNSLADRPPGAYLLRGQPAGAKSARLASSNGRLSRLERSVSQQVLEGSGSRHQQVGASRHARTLRADTLEPRGATIGQSECGLDERLARRSTMMRSPAVARTRNTATALNRSVSMRQSLAEPAGGQSLPTKSSYRRIVHTPISTAAIRREAGYEEEEEEEEQLGLDAGRLAQQDKRINYLGGSQAMGGREGDLRHEQMAASGGYQQERPRRTGAADWRGHRESEDDSESPMTRTWANPALVRVGPTVQSQRRARVRGEQPEEGPVQCSSEFDSEEATHEQYPTMPSQKGAPSMAGRSNPQMEDAHFQYHSENSSEFSSSLLDQNPRDAQPTIRARNLEGTGLDDMAAGSKREACMDYDDSQQRLNQIGLPDPTIQSRYSQPGASLSHLDSPLSRIAPTSGLNSASKVCNPQTLDQVSTACYSGADRSPSRPSIVGRAMSQQSLTRPTMPLSRRLRRSGRASATMGDGGFHYTSGAASDLGGSSFSLASRLRDGSRYESAHTRLPVVMYIPPATSKSSQASRHNSATDLSGARDRSSRSPTVRKSTRSRPVSQARSSLASTNIGTNSRAGRSVSARQSSDSETSSMLRTLIRPRGRPSTKSGSSSRLRRRSSSRRRISNTNANEDTFYEDEDAIGQLASEMDSYKFTRRYSVPKDAKINWFSKLRQRVTSSNKNQ